MLKIGTQHNLMGLLSTLDINFKLWAKKGIWGQIWSGFIECSNVPETFHIAQIESADFQTLSKHFFKIRQKILFFIIKQFGPSTNVEQ